jgi:hypothetical protein
LISFGTPMRMVCGSVRLLVGMRDAGCGTRRGTYFRSPHSACSGRHSVTPTGRA